ncbi:flagellar hook-associated protein FlgK [Anaeromyxobacter diazotrophicus]|uniref:Flagellar hook-associated protein 1 n=1 Tax=Anaeromyxobacter diazotrophicus TaxID=2590199 RepID=A0A7I9VRW5_9BACT|nr:flagellar hook-associated protein FlgK [Anaeromyxobacter diazotrophicus]GEJ59176.1 flagellar hook-associated protein 1 [Anaeromyxobacter diazotrophicus]
MADLLSILSGAATSLSAQRALSATASHNLDNANNAGYSRQTASLEALVPAEQVNGAYLGRGATLGTVTQARDRFLEAQLPAAFGNAAFSTAQSDALQAFHGLDPDATGGLSDAISGFYSALSSLAQNPSDAGLRSSFLGAARSLAQTFNRTSQGLEAARSGLDAKVGALAGEVNVEASAVASLNVQIRQAGANGGTPNDLLDLRQQHLDRLAELTGATTIPTSTGDVNVALPGGVALVAGDRAASLATEPDPGNAPHLRVTMRLPDGSGPAAVPNASLGGTLGGTLSARDGTLAQTGQDVDHLAYDLAQAVNAQHAAGFKLDGTAGQPVFDAGASAAGAAGRLTLLLASGADLALSATTSGTSAPSGDAGNANALLATGQAALATSGKDVQATVAQVVSSFGSAASTSKAFAAQDGALKDSLATMRESTSGVSIDEEMIALQRAQRGYEAISKVIQTADQMLETLLNLR